MKYLKKNTGFMAAAEITVMAIADFDHWFNGINNDGRIAVSRWIL